MKSYDELEAKIEAIQQQMVETNKNSPTNVPKDERRLSKEFGFTASMQQESIEEGRKNAG